MLKKIILFIKYLKIKSNQIKSKSALKELLFSKFRFSIPFSKHKKKKKENSQYDLISSEKNLKTDVKKDNQSKLLKPKVSRSDLIILADALELLMENAEPKFLKLGEELQLLYKDAKELAELTIKSSEAISGESDESLLNSMGMLAKQSLKELQQCQKEISESLKNVDMSATYLEKLCKICPVIEKTGMSLNVVGLNIAVESSRSSESREMFTVLVQEIRHLSKDVLEIAQNIFNDSKATQSSQLDAHAKIMKGMAELGKLQHTAQKTVQNTVQEIRQMIELSLQALEKSSLLSQEISNQVGEVVVAIQFHDITRQQVEHIVSAIRDIDYLCERERADTAEPPESNIWGCVHKILNLQAVQLRQVIWEIDTAYQKSVHAFENIGDQVGKLVEGVSVLDSSENQKQTWTETRISDLKSDLRELNMLLSQGYDLKHQIRETSEQVYDTTSRLSRHIGKVRGISMELHLKALNAIIKSARLMEEGETFEILAQEVNKLSKESNQFVADVVKILERIIGLTRKVTIEPDKENHLTLTRGSLPVSTLRGKENISFEACIHEITDTYEQFRTNSMTALQQVQELQSEILQTTSDLNFLSELSDEMTFYLRQIEKTIKRLESWSNQEEASLENDKIDQLAQRYTMKRERDLHKNFIYPSDVPEESLPVISEDSSASSFEEDQKKEKTEKETDDDDDDDLGDNVELF